MRVLHLVKTTRGAGFALRQVAALRRLGVEVVVALPSATDGLAPRYVEAGAEVVAADLDFGVQAPWRLLPALARCRAVVAETKPDVIHSHFFATTLVARLALGRYDQTPRIFQVPGPLHLEHATTRWLDLATSGPADAWIASCRWTRDEYLRRGVAPDRVFLSYYGLDPAAWQQPIDATLRGGFRRSLGLDDVTPLIGMVAYTYAPKRYLGQHRGIKGHESFIDAIAAVQRVRPEVRAVIVGGPWVGAERYQERLRRRARRRCGDAIIFSGERTDIPTVYADLDLVVHPSLSENCGGAGESLAAGCPTIATKVGGLPDLVIDGETGWLVPPREPHRLAAAILTALAEKNEGRRRAANGRRLVAHLLDVERTAGEVAAAYGNVAVARRPLTPSADVTSQRTTAPRQLAASETAA